jgi:large subunit ribosomal protein L5
MNKKKRNNSKKFLSLNRENLSKKYYQKILTYDLLLKQNYKNIMQLPCLNKLVLNTTSKTYVSDKKFILFTLAALELLSGQKPQLTYARKSVANFKIRQHQILGCKVVLRENQMYTFLDKLSKIVFPRIRDSSIRKVTSLSKSTISLNSKLNKNSLLQISAYTVGFNNLMIFPELENHYELVERFRGMDLTFILSNSNKETSLLVLSGFQLPVN